MAHDPIGFYQHDRGRGEGERKKEIRERYERERELGHRLHRVLRPHLILQYSDAIRSGGTVPIFFVVR